MLVDLVLVDPVLVDLEAVDPDEAGELLVESWRVRAPKKLVDRFDASQP